MSVQFDFGTTVSRLCAFYMRWEEGGEWGVLTMYLWLFRFHFFRPHFTTIKIMYTGVWVYVCVTYIYV